MRAYKTVYNFAALLSPASNRKTVDANGLFIIITGPHFHLVL